jgi:xanthine dehydrogenase accessory factor
MTTIFETLSQNLDANKLIATVTIIRGPETGSKLLVWPNGNSLGEFNNKAVQSAAVQEAMNAFIGMKNTRSILASADEEVEIFIDIHLPPKKIIIIGAVHIAMPLVSLATVLGFETIVLDARAAFATRERFPNADKLIKQWPADALEELALDESTSLVFLTHDEKLDNPALKIALSSPARYIGALGSRKTHVKRLAALTDMGLSTEQLTRIHAPIGLDLGARVPEEIALSILAEIIAVQRGGAAQKKGLK